MTRFTLLALASLCACSETAPENQAPTIADTIADVTMLNGDTATINLSRHFTDPDGDPLAFRAESRDPDVLDVSIERDLLAIVARRPPDAQVRVWASDPDSAQAMQEFRATVKTLPIVSDSIRDHIVRAGSETAIPLWEFFADPDGDVLMYSATSSEPKSVEVSVKDSTLTILAAEHISATATITASAADTLGRASQTFDVTVTRPATIADSIPDRILRADSSAAIHLGEHFADPDSEELVYSAISRGPRIVEVSVEDGTLTMDASHIPAAATIAVSAADNLGKVTQTFEVAVTPPPAVWREDFDSTLAGWELIRQRGESSFEAVEGAMEINLLSRPAKAIANSDSVVDIEDEWTVTVSAAANDGELCSSFAALTGDTITLGWRFDIAWGSPPQWGVWVSRWREDTWTLIRSGALLSLPELGDYVTASITLVDDILTLVAGNRVVIHLSLAQLWGNWDDEWPTGITSVKLDALNWNFFCGGSGWDGKSTALFDWVGIGPAK